ncbi:MULTISPECIES: AbiTii domain-containing protein [Streptomyces]|uniref:AbiTii domain-containing protein n=1 Tax=Streptomyces TaxID=1883 RepID=UPI0033B3F930
MRVADELLADIEVKRLKTSEIVLKASRLARLVGHTELTEFLGFERNGYPADGSARMWIGRAGRWADRGEGAFYTHPIAKVEAQVESGQQAIDAMRGGGNYSGDMIVSASRNHDERILKSSANLGTWTGICGQVVATVYDMVTEIYHELLFSELQASLFEDTQEKVDGSLAAASGTALEKIERISDRLRDGDPESVSQALTTCRRLIDSSADYVFPARDEPYKIGDEVNLKVGPQQVLNRLQAHTHACGASKSRRDRLRRTLSDLYDRCSAGTHAEVTIDEARFIFLQAYIALGEILTLSAPEGRES